MKKNDNGTAKTGNNDKGSSGTPRPVTKRGRRGLERPLENASKVGAGHQITTRRNARKALADPLPGAKKAKAQGLIPAEPVNEVLKPGEVVVVYGSSLPKGMPEDEAGPNVSFERPYEGESPMSPTTLFAAAIMQAWGENIFINGNMRKIYVVADVDIDEPTRRWAASHAARYTGSFTAAVRAMDRVCWLPMVRNFSAQDIAQIVRGEVALAMEDKSMWTGEIMILIHRELPQSFGGICPRALGQLICDEVFTFSEFSLEDK